MAYRIIPPEEHARRKEVYDLGLSDGQSAKILGIPRTCYQYWRSTSELPPHLQPGQTLYKPREKVAKRKPPKIYAKRISMEEALPPEGCQLVNGFLRCLVTYTKQVPAERKVDVATFMEEWRKHTYGTNWPGYTRRREMRG